MDGYPATCFTSAASRFRMFFVRDAEAKSSLNRLRTNIKNYVLNFNKFDKRVPLHVTSHELRNGIYSTRIFLFSLIVSLTALVLFGALLNETQTVTISNVTEEEYQKLEQKYSQTLRCPCQKISIEYKEFSSIQPILHPICSSVYVTDQWYSGYLSFPANSLPYPFLNTLRGPQSFRSIGPAQFRLLSLFCNPTSCTYTRIAKRGLLSTVSLIVGLVGGLTTILKLVIPPIVAFLRRNKRPPPSSQSNTDRRRRQRRKKCIGYRPLWQHRARSRR
ncbi:hypothetical protein I4U23_016743 [Adineta vaga]|nr:hypothetical protein I4U23_016743 [Adineta vaga]